MMTKRIDVTQHCEGQGNAITTLLGDTKVTAGKTSMLFTPYWYVKYHRGEKPDVVLFSNPLDWLGYLERLMPISGWLLVNSETLYELNNPAFARMQWLTRGVENGKTFVHKDMRIWATPPLVENDAYTYHFSIGEKAQHRGFGNRMKRQWKTAIKPYLWDWAEEVRDEQPA